MTEQGYDATTVEQIAQRAGVSHMTFFRHFPTKQAVVLDDPYDPAMADALRRQDASLPALEQVRRALLAAWAALPEPDDDRTRVRVRLAATHPALRAGVWSGNQRTEDLLVAVLLERDVPALEARVAAGACLGALMAALLHWGVAEDGPPLGSVVRTALEQLRGRGPEVAARD
ncbi:TetR/AcrR family transcriptional regulator [Cellulomonas sp. C5510]|nr:TetR/AcrR family transcriptional regulator [Cellulomonas sp. C5510]